MTTEGIRWYQDGLAARRFVSRHFSGYWTLSPTGEGPFVTVTGHSNFWTEWLVPGDEATEQDTFHGLEVLAKAPDGGIVAQITGVFLPDETHHGIFQIPDDDASVQAALCDALT